jgi:hypothetical protein
MWGSQQIRAQLAASGTRSAMPAPRGEPSRSALARRSAVRRPGFEAPAAAPQVALTASLPATARPGRLAEDTRAEDVRATAGAFFGADDERLLAPLRESGIRSVRVNRGGSSISLRLELESGARGAFKPQQTNGQTVPRKEIAAFRISRLLGVNAVPPAIGRQFRLDELLARLDEQSRPMLPRLRAEIIAVEGEVAGELSYWIPAITHAEVDGFRIDSLDGIVTWKRYLTVDRATPEAQAPLLAQISSLLLFDFLINNPDRWSGGNAMASPDQRVLYFMDNTLSFGSATHPRVRTYLHRSQKFSRRLVEALRALDRSRLVEALAGDLGPYPQLLREQEITAVLARRREALAYVEKLCATHGEQKVLVFP